MIRIKRYSDFVSEGLLKNLLGTVKSSFSSKKSKLDSILNKIRESKMDLLKESDAIKKEIAEKFHKNRKDDIIEIEAINKTLNTLGMAKNQEIENLKKEAIEIIDENPEPLEYFQHQLSKIDLEVMEETIKMAKKYDSPEDLRKLEDDFERLIIASTGIPHHNDSYYKTQDAISEIDPEIQEFLEIPTSKVEFYLSNTPIEKLDDMERSLRKYSKELREIMGDSTANLRRQLARARRSSDTYTEAVIRKEIRSIESTYREEYDIVRERLNKVIKEAKKRYETKKDK